MTNSTPELWNGPPPHELQGLLAERGVRARTRHPEDAPSAEVVVSWPDLLHALAELPEGERLPWQLVRLCEAARSGTARILIGDTPNAADDSVLYLAAVFLVGEPDDRIAALSLLVGVYRLWQEARTLN